MERTNRVAGGQRVFTVALPLEVLRLTGSSLDLALIVSARTIPAVVLLLVGGTRNVPADMLGRASSVDWALSLALSSAWARSRRSFVIVCAPVCTATTYS